MNAMSGDHRAPFIVEYSGGKCNNENGPNNDDSLTESVIDEHDSLDDIDLSEVDENAGSALCEEEKDQL